MPMVNGQTIGVQAHALNDHDVIDLTGMKMEFYLGLSYCPKVNNSYAKPRNAQSS